jgi:hypothetical protein
MTNQTYSSALGAILARFANAGAVVYGGTEPEGEAAARAYRFHRNRNKPAKEALRLALEDKAAGRSRWPSGESPSLGAAMESDSYGLGGARWAELPELMGFRFAGFTDELRKAAGYRSEGSGYYIDDSYSEVARGCVYQLPAKDGRPRFVPAIRIGSEGKRGWQDQSGSDSAILFLPDIVTAGDCGADGARYQASEWEEAQEAARYADSRAERYAEAEREYQEAYSAGREAAESLEEAGESRRAFLELRAELKDGCAIELDGAGRPKTRAALESVLKGHCGAWRAAKRRAAELREEWSGLGAWRSHLESAFSDGLAS